MHARQIQLARFQFRFRQAFFRFVFRHAGRFFN